jgi:hypothetical protein
MVEDKVQINQLNIRKENGVEKKYTDNYTRQLKVRIRILIDNREVKINEFFILVQISHQNRNKKQLQSN